MPQAASCAAKAFPLKPLSASSLRTRDFDTHLSSAEAASCSRRHAGINPYTRLSRHSWIPG